MDLGKPKVKNLHIPMDEQWMDVPLGFNNNEKEVPAESLCHSVPIAHEQGSMKMCLFASVASALVCMLGHSEIAEHIVRNMMECVHLSAQEQWKCLTDLMCNDAMSKVHFAKFNFRRGKKDPQNTNLMLNR